MAGQWLATFESVAEAEQYALAFVREHPSAECCFFVRPDYFFRRITATSDETRGT